MFSTMQDRNRKARRRSWLAWAALVVALGPVAAAAQEGVEPEKIRDNLFLLEEAYNQEPGVIQHIQSYRRGNDGWSYSFTEEMPVPKERHQLSVTLPALREAPGGGGEAGRRPRELPAPGAWRARDRGDGPAALVGASDR